MQDIRKCLRWQTFTPAGNILMIYTRLKTFIKLPNNSQSGINYDCCISGACSRIHCNIKPYINRICIYELDHFADDQPSFYENMLDHIDRTLLHPERYTWMLVRAVNMGNIDMVKYALKKGADPWLTYNNGRCFVNKDITHKAAINNRLDILAYFVKHDIVPNINYGRIFRHARIAKYLLGAPNIRDKDFQKIYKTIVQNNGYENHRINDTEHRWKIIRIFIRSGRVYPTIAYHKACDGCIWSQMKWLIKNYGCDPQPAYKKICEYYSWNHMKWLIEHYGCDPEPVYKKACREYKWRIVRWILNRGKCNPADAYKYACSYENIHWSIIDDFINNRLLGMFATRPHEIPPMDIARVIYWLCARGQFERFKHFIQRQSQQKVIDKSLVIASSQGYLDLVKYLIGLGADPHYEQDRALYVACQNKCIDVVKYLVHHAYPLDD